ncbi:MAG: hypothetical protein WC528_04210 [Patescibacteria group bacterium]
MKKSVIFALCLLAGTALILTGCGKSAAEKAAEKAAESATNGQADVDLSNQKITVNTNGSTIEVGGDIALPSGFPEDVYVVDGTIKSASTVNEGKGYSVMIETNQSVADLKDLYDAKLKEEGWNITFSMNLGDSFTMAAEKGNRTANVTLGQGEEANTVLIGTSEK